jgi:16S rRNA pseudouridine516 synthase
MSKKSAKTPIPDRDEACLEDILLSQGFGTRRECRGIVQAGWVQLRDAAGSITPADDPDAWLDPRGLTLLVRGQAWPVCSSAVVVLHKPTGHECSQKPKAWPSVLSLLPAPLRNRGLQPVGRLDQDTTGLLLLTDDGALIHRLTSPKHHVPKVYEVTTKHPVDAQQVERLLTGVVLDDDPAPVRAAACVQTGELTLDLTLTEGKYHQVKRMVAAVSNRVEGLHRRSIGGLAITDALAPGQWRWLAAAERPAIGLPD